MATIHLTIKDTAGGISVETKTDFEEGESADNPTPAMITLMMAAEGIRSGMAFFGAPEGLKS